MGYLPSRIEEIVALWKEDLSTVSETAAEALATPASNPELFADLNIGFQVEQMFLAQRDATKATGMAGVEYMTAKDDLELNLIELIKAQQGGGETKEADPADVAVEADPADVAVEAAPEVDADAAAAVEADAVA